jgi:beta-N-acetylhexosaminidase
VVRHARERLESVEFVPFRAAIRARAAGIMSAHVTFPAIDSTPGLAATLSHKVLTGLLREEMQYDGIIMTDELTMGALATLGHPAPQAAAEALAAGADILLLQSGFEMHREVQREVLARLADGRIPMRRLDDAVRRVLVLKQRFGVLDPARAPSHPEPVGTDETRALSRVVAARSITLVRDEAHLLPLKPDSKLFIIETGKWGLGNRLGATTMQVPAQPRAADINSVLPIAKDGRTVIVAASDVARNPQQADLVKALVDARVPLIVVAMRSPYDLASLKNVSTYIAIYGANPPTLDALADVLTGKAKAQGQLPVELTEMTP